MVMLSVLPKVTLSWDAAAALQDLDIDGHILYYLNHSHNYEHYVNIAHQLEQQILLAHAILGALNLFGCGSHLWWSGLTCLPTKR